MQTVTYKHVLDVFCEMAGINTGSEAASTETKASFNRLFNRVARRGWNFWFWPELMLLEERHYRDEWAAGTYTEDDEVYHADTDEYYVCTAASTTEEPSSSASDWDVITSLDAYIGYEQEGETAIGRFKEIWSGNFRTSGGCHQLPFEVDERGARLTGAGVPRSAWVYFQKRCPTWRGADWASDGTYSAGVVKYFSSGTDAYEGDFWTCLATTSAAESPITHPAKWSKIEIPAWLCDFIANGAKLGFIEGDAQLDKALAANGPAWDWLYDEIDALRAQGGQFKRARVANI